MVDIRPIEQPLAGLTVFPQSASYTVQVVLPDGMHGQGELLVLDMAGRVLRTQGITDPTTLVPVDDLPDGLYSLRAMVQGRNVTARISVRH